MSEQDYTDSPEGQNALAQAYEDARVEAEGGPMISPSAEQLPELEIDIERCHGDVVRRVTEDAHYVLNDELTPSVRTRVFYECPECGRRLKESK